MRGATSGNPPSIEPASLTDRGTAEEITGRLDLDREEWDTEWAAERAARAMRFLAEHYPECSGSAALYPHQNAAHEAAFAGDREAYLEALRSYMRVGRDVTLRVRKGEAA
jgi:hypothetical protein